MANNRTANKKQGKSRLFRIFIITLISVIAVPLVLGAAFVLAYNAWIHDGTAGVAAELELETGLRQGGAWSDLVSMPESATFLILGLDEGQSGARRADLIMLAHYNSVTNEADIISIPRDTRVEVPPHWLTDTRFFRWRPSSNILKIGDIHNLAGNDAVGTELTVHQVEALTGVSIDFFVRVDLAGFRQLVDAVNGIEFYVPQRMFYTDPYQDLVIDLHPGLQTLNGEQAEGLVRFRRADRQNPQGQGYAMGDLRRVEVQQDFVAAALTQVLGARSLSALSSLATTAINHVNTNFPVTAIPRFTAEAINLTADSINTHTLPGTATNVSPWFYLPNNERIEELIAGIWP